MGVRQGVCDIPASPLGMFAGHWKALASCAHIMWIG